MDCLSSYQTDPVGDEIFSYVGQWEVEEPEVYPGIPGDKGLVLSTSFTLLFPSVAMLLKNTCRNQGCSPCHLYSLHRTH